MKMVLYMLFESSYISPLFSKKQKQCEMAKSYVFALHTAAVLAVRGPAKTYLSYQNNMKTAIFFVVNKKIDNAKVEYYWPLLKVSDRIPGLI